MSQSGGECGYDGCLKDPNRKKEKPAMTWKTDESGHPTPPRGQPRATGEGRLELARGVCALTKDVLASQQAASRSPQPSPKQMAHHLLTKLTPADYIEAYLHTFEVVAEREVWG
ncbi:hypothetical protein SRHO_G00168060 [Serrasalmus rhombeus]